MVQRRCPHLKADLSRFGSREATACSNAGCTDGASTSASGRCLTAEGHDIVAVRVEGPPGVTAASAEAPTSGRRLCPVRSSAFKALEATCPSRTATPSARSSGVAALLPGRGGRARHNAPPGQLHRSSRARKCPTALAAPRKAGFAGDLAVSCDLSRAESPDRTTDPGLEVAALVTAASATVHSCDHTERRHRPPLRQDCPAARRSRRSR